MEPLNICVVQMAIDDANVAANVRKIAALADELDGQNLNLVLLPELCDFGYDLQTIRSRFDTDESPAVGAMKTVAETLRCFVAGGVVESDADSLYDSLVVIGPEGNRVASYRKIQLFGPGEEKDVFEPGSRLETFRIGSWGIGLAVCNDLRYPEIARGLTVRGIDALLLSAAWPFPRVRHFTTLLEARAIENQIFVAASNRVGRTGDTILCGSSRILDPHGDIVSSASEDKETLIRATLDPSALEWVRRRPGWKERRVDFDS
jgi:predicted amidohydrolase